MSKKDKLSKKEKGFVKDWLETGNGVQSALKNYDTDDYSTAGVIAHENLKKPKIIKLISDMLPDELLAEKHLKLLNKQQVQLKNNVSSGEIDIIQTGEIDPMAVAKGLDMAYKLKGSYAPEKKEVTGTLSIQPSQEDLELAQIINEQRRNTRTDIES